MITAENREDVLPRFFHCSKREAKAVSAELHPVQAAPHRDVLTAVRNEAPAPEQPSVPSAAVTLVQPVEPHKLVHPVEPRPGDDLVQPDELPAPTGSGRDGPPRATPSMHVAREQRDVVEPLTAELRRFHVTVSRRFLEKLEAARGALSHARPAASTDEILEAALDLLLEQHAKKKGIVEKPPAKRRPSESNRLSAHVKRAVWTRDGGRCQWPLASGGICGSTLRVEFDHLVPRARGGPSTVDNVRLLCRVHNDVAARRIFGDEWMDRFTSQGPSEAVAAPESSAAPTPLA